ncbi:MAG: 50S ribosomal protein L13 [Candidatus Pacearchaeota archaeon]|jgi:large subunit ribosomal protein L13
MEKIIIDATNSVVGRLSSYVAQKALQGNEIVILNSEKSLITGNRKYIVEKYANKKARGGTAQKGPNFARPSQMILKRSVRGMLPNYRWGIGKQAYSRIKCYDGVPKEFAGHKAIKVETSKSNKFIDLKEVTKNI